MSFMAIVHAPALRSGARLCISDLDQAPGQPPHGLAAGSTIELRYGTCRPALACAAISARDDDEAVLRTAEADWTIRRSDSGGVDVPGLMADDWIVIGRA